MELEKLSTTELISFYSSLIGTLKKRGVIRTKNVIGDLGEFLAIEHYNNTPRLSNLQAAPSGTQNVDAISRKGERYSIKSTSGKLTSVFYGLHDPDSKDVEKQKFEFVIIVIFNNDFALERIIEINWNQFLQLKRWHKTMRGWNIPVTKKLYAVGKTIYTNKSPVSK